MSQHDFLERAPLSLATNREPRCACVLLLDTSGSMDGEPIHELNKGLEVFASTVKEDSLAALRVEPLVITFDDNVVVHGEFVTADEFSPPTLAASGSTKMGHGILKAMEMIEERKRQYKAANVSYYRPWILLITDGFPTDENDGTFGRAVQVVKSAETNEEKKVALFTVAVEGADMAKLAEISSRPPKKLKGLEFRDLFLWLSASMGRVSASTPGTQSQLPATTWDAP